MNHSVMIASMTDVTRILNQIEQGDPSASDELLPIVYEELRVLARQRLSNEKPGQTLQATALVHEAYLRLVGKENDQNWDNRGHFFAAAAEAMRRVLINRAESKGRLKRSGKRDQIDVEKIVIALDTPDDDLIALDTALSELAERDSDCAALIKLRFFAGLSLREAAKSLGIPPRSANRRWAYGRAWLFERLSR